MSDSTTWISMEFCTVDLGQSVDKFQIWLKLDKNNKKFT